MTGMFRAPARAACSRARSAPHRGRSDQDRIRARRFRRLGIGDRVLGAHRAGADDRRQPAADDLAREAHQGEPLLRRLGVVLAGGARDDQPVHVRGDQVLDDLGEAVAVDPAHSVVRRDDGRVDTLEA